MAFIKDWTKTKLKSPSFIRRDITGVRFGSIVAVEHMGISGNNHLWRVKCDCGVEETVQLRVIVSLGKVSCRKCAIKSGRKHHAWRGVGDISQDVFNTIRHSAAQRDYEFDITNEYLWGLFLRQKKKCALTGVDICFNKKHSEKTLKTASLDRKDSKAGYVKGNLQWVHRDVNKMKKNLPDGMFVDICLKVAKNLGYTKHD